MIRRLRHLSAWVALLLASAAPAAALDVLLVSPPSGRPALGTVEVAVEVLSERPVARLEVRVDGRRVARLTEPPWRVRVDLGEENREHHFEVLAVDAAGERRSVERTTPALRVDEVMDLALQQLYVTVTDGGRRRVDLERGDFTVFDDGERQELVTFEQGDVPITAALLVDASFSLRGEALRTSVDACRRFIGELGRLDEAAVLLFADGLLYASPFTGDQSVLSEGLDSVRGGGGTAANDHLYLALNLLEQRQGRRVVVLLSDGIDVESSLSVRDVLWKARRSSAQVYWIRLGEEGRPDVARHSAWRSSAEHRDELAGLGRVVQESGGAIYDVAGVEEVGGALAEILALLRDQYVLGYYPTTRRDDESWHSVRVGVSPPGCRVQVRKGYID